MNLQQEASNQILQTTILLLIESGKMTLHIVGRGATQITAMLGALLSQQNKTRGAMRLSSLLRSGTGLEVYTIRPDQLKAWAQVAKQYGVPYTVVKGDTLDDGMLDIFIRPEDAPRVNRMCERAHLELTPMATVESREATEQEIQAAREANPEWENFTITEIPDLETATELDADALIDRILADDTAQITDAVLESPAEDAAFDALFDAPPEVLQPEKEPLEQADFTIAPVLEPGQFVIEEIPDTPEAPMSGNLAGISEPDAIPAALEKQQTATPPAALPEDAPSPQPSERKPNAGQNLNGLSKPSVEQGANNEWTYQRVNREWPLSHPKAAFTMAQRMEIHRAFSDGLPPEVVDKLALPQLSPENMSFLRECRDEKLMDAFAYSAAGADDVERRPSVMKQIEDIRAERVGGIEPAVPAPEPALTPEI